MEKMMQNAHETAPTFFKKNWIWFLLGAVVILVFAIVLSFLLRNENNTPRDQIASSSQNGSGYATGSGNGGGPGGNTGASSSNESQGSWEYTGSDWTYMGGGTPPTCASKIISVAPTNTALATSILYPGQTRGGNYKPHGGFRFDNVRDNAVTVKVPFDATLLRGSRYLVNGETQYTFDFIAPCGIMFRLGHLLVLDSKYQAIADTFPAAQEGDSRTTNVNPPLSVKAGDVIATKVGVTKGGVNTFFDFGVYDLRTKNQASQDPAYTANTTMHDAQLAQHAVCWFDWLPEPDATRVKNLPAGDPASGKTSDYCK